MVDKNLNITADDFWAEIEEFVKDDQPPPQDEGWFTVRDFAERFDMSYDRAKRYLASRQDTFEKRKYKYWAYYRLIKDD